MGQHQEEDQIRIQFGGETSHRQLRVLDLFSGIGGLALGFQASGFHVTGVDSEETASEVFRLNEIGTAIRKNLFDEVETPSVAVVVGGPPCRPWSAVNVVRRGTAHDDHALLDRFFLHLQEIRPDAFLIENVPALGSDAEFHRLLRVMQWRGYSIKSEVLQYSDFGAATTRRRLFTVGFRDSVRWSADEFFSRLTSRHRRAGTVREAIDWLKDVPRGGVPDHEWSEVKTIAKYAERYRTGRFGWRQLEWDHPAPSFGSVSKTYILHPGAGDGDQPQRVLSVREILSIMGFSRRFRFPAGTALSKRYRMVANAVCPQVSGECAMTIREMLTGEVTAD